MPPCGAHHGAVCPEPLLVAITGGPASGKSSALPLLRTKLSGTGFQVITVPETATHFLMNSDGIQENMAEGDGQVYMQRLSIEYQLAQEEAFVEFARLHPTKPAIVLLDRCTMDSKVFLTDGKWRRMLTLPGKKILSEDDLLHRYDVVIHLATSAGHANSSSGVHSNNPARHHSPEEAKALDDRTGTVFQAHAWLRDVPYMASFDDKIDAVLGFVQDAMHHRRGIVL